MSTTSSAATAMSSLRAAAQRMQHDERFKVIFEEYRAADQADIDAWQDMLQSQPGLEQHKIPPDLQAIYRATGGFRFQWQYLLAKTVTTGSAQIADLMSLYQRDDERDQPLSAIYAHSRPFDILDQQRLVAIRFARDEHQPLSMVYVDSSSARQRKLTLQPLEYLQTLATFVARFDWQLLFEDGKAPDEAARQAVRQEVQAVLRELKG